MHNGGHSSEARYLDLSNNRTVSALVTFAAAQVSS